MSLSFPPADADPGDRNRYIVDPIFQFELQAGTLFVFAPLDDLFFLPRERVPQEGQRGGWSGRAPICLRVSLAEARERSALCCSHREVLCVPREVGVVGEREEAGHGRKGEEAPP